MTGWRLPPRRPLTPRRPWQRLQWRLTLLYLLAATLTSVLLNLAAAAWLIYVLVYSPTLPEEITDSLRQGGVEAAAFFGPNKIDKDGLVRWLDRQSTEIGDGSIGFLQSDKPTDRAAVAMADKRGVVLASTPSAPASSLFPVGTVLESHLSREERRLLAEAWQGKTQTRRSGARFIGAGPILREGNVVGVGFLRTGPDFSLQIVVRQFAPLLLSGTLYTAFGAAFVGGLFGYGTARSVTRRLERISSVADQWAAGDLKATAPESPPDEFGMLGQRLNGMADDLDQVLLLRRQIAVLEERQRLARDLHDTVKQQAFAGALLIGAAQICLEAGDIAGAGAVLTEAETVAQQIQTDLAAVLTNRNTESTDDLPSILQRITSDWTRRSGVSIRLKNYISGSEAIIGAANGAQAVRIAEEAIANAVKHSKSARIDVLLERKGGQIQLSIKDQGVGFDPNAPRGAGMGLSAMRERAALLPQGDLEIRSTPDVGTDVILRFSEYKHGRHDSNSSCG